MKRARGALFWLLLLVGWIARAQAAEEFAFDAAEFEKKRFEIGGYAEIKREELTLNSAGAYYRLNYFNQPQRETLGRTVATLQLVGKLRPGAGTFDFRTNSNYQQDQLLEVQNNKVYDAAYSVRPAPGITLEAGKRELRWGKGYAWNPIGFVERPKNPDDPQLAREGYWMAFADLIFNPGGDLQTVALTPVLLPVSSNVNSDFGAPDHLNPTAKLYLLYRDTDIDIAWQGRGSRPARFGMDFSRNLASNFEIHGEWVRILKLTRVYADSAGTVTTTVGDATSYLLGMRYLSAGDTTYIAEYYRNGTGFSDLEFQQFYQLVSAGAIQIAQAGSAALLQKAVAVSRRGYASPNAGTDYLYFRAQQKDALGIVYFQPAITAIVNWRDGSYQVTPELAYTGINNLELRARLYLLQGGSRTDFGEKPSSRRLEFYARYYF